MKILYTSIVVIIGLGLSCALLMGGALLVWGGGRSSETLYAATGLFGSITAIPVIGIWMIIHIWLPKKPQ